MSKFIAPVFILIVCSWYIGTCLCDNMDRSSGSGLVSPQASVVKDTRAFSPAGLRLYKLLKNAPLMNRLDDTDEENYYKKRGYDDYGHMRFGKRSKPTDFDDYGHMRFGK